MSHLDRFPTLSTNEYHWILRKPTERVRCVIDTDTRNEIDDQFALAWALLSQDMLNIEAIYAAPYSFRTRLDEIRKANSVQNSADTARNEGLVLLHRYAGQLKRLAAKGIDINDDSQIDPQNVTMVTPGVGMEKSYQEILLVCEKMGIDFADKVYRGSNRYLESYDTPVQSDAVDHLIETAKTASPDDPLQIVAIGATTNIASALLLAPEIIRNVVVSWTAGYPTSVMGVFQESFNMEQDMLSSQLLFDSGVPLVYLPGFHVGVQLGLSLPEMETWIKGKGEIGDYLYWLFMNNPHYPFQGLDDYFGRTWVIWDLINFAWLMNPDWVPTFMTDAPYLTDDQKWLRKDEARHPMREALDINRDAIFRDFFTKLDDATKS
jgi:purine nucleosidase